MEKNRNEIPFADELSEMIYDRLLRLVEEKNIEHLLEAIKLSGIEPDPALLWHIKLKEMAENGIRLILYGLGKSAKYMQKLDLEMRKAPGFHYFPFLGDIDWFAMCDKNFGDFPEGFLGKRVISPNELLSFKDENICVCIGAPDFYEEIEKELIEFGMLKEKIVRHIYPHIICYENKQYFDDFVKVKKESTVIDGGCFRCDTVERFIEWNSEKGYDKIIAYEPDSVNYKLCKKKIEENGWKNVELINAGLSEWGGGINFIENGDDSSYVSDIGTKRVKTVSIDESTEGKNVSFIKLDVEGFELLTLKGAKECIKKYHPRMAIALYHKKEDIIEIPQYIMELSNDYKFYLRIYSNEWFEIVLYAI